MDPFSAATEEGEWRSPSHRPPQPTLGERAYKPPPLISRGYHYDPEQHLPFFATPTRLVYEHLHQPLGVSGVACSINVNDANQHGYAHVRASSIPIYSTNAPPRESRPAAVVPRTSISDSQGQHVTRHRRPRPHPMFSPFARLPPEIRYVIWKLALTPRRITMVPVATLMSLSPSTFLGGTRLKWHASPTPSVFLACREAYHAVALLYKRSLFPCPMVPAHCGGGGLSPIAIPINTELDTIEFAAEYLVDARSFPGTRQPHPDRQGVRRMMLPLVGLTLYDRPLPGIGWSGWANNLRHLSFRAALIGHAAHEDVRLGHGGDTGEVWTCLVEYLERSPAFQTCTITMTVPSECLRSGGRPSRFLARTESQRDNIRAIRIARKPACDSDGAISCACHGQPGRSGDAQGGVPQGRSLARTKRAQARLAPLPEAMRLAGSSSCLLLQDPRLKLDCRDHELRGVAASMSGARCPHHPHLLTKYRHHLAIFELLDAEQQDLFFGGKAGADSVRARRLLQMRMSRHYCTVACHRPRQTTSHRRRRLPSPAWPLATSVPDDAYGPNETGRRDDQVSIEPRAGQHQVVFGDSFNGDMYLLLHDWIMAYRHVGTKKLRVGVHGVCTEDYGW